MLDIIPSKLETDLKEVNFFKLLLMLHDNTILNKSYAFKCFNFATNKHIDSVANAWPMR